MTQYLIQRLGYVYALQNVVQQGRPYKFVFGKKLVTLHQPPRVTLTNPRVDFRVLLGSLPGIEKMEPSELTRITTLHDVPAKWMQNYTVPAVLTLEAEAQATALREAIASLTKYNAE